MRNLLFWIVVVTNLFWGAAVADNTDSKSVSVGGMVIKALEMTTVSALRFGPVARPNKTTDPADTDTTATITVTDQETGAFTVVYEGDGDGTGNPGASNLPGAPNDPAPAELSVTGEPNFNYAMTYGGLIFGFLPLDPGVIVVPDDTLPSSTQTIPGSGSDTLYIGGQFRIEDVVGLTTGTKSGTFDVTITYD